MKIISLSPAMTEILYAIGAGEMIVANTYLCDYPEDAKKLPKVGSFAQVDINRIKKCNPDIIFTSTVVQKKIFDELSSKGLPVVHVDPRSLEEIIDSIEKIGKQVNKEETATYLVSQMKKKIDKLAKKQFNMRPRVYIEEWYDPPMYSGNWVPDIVRLAGGEYGLAKKRGISKQTSEKELFEFDPEYMFVSYCGFGKKSDPNKILKRSGWGEMNAVKNKRVYVLNETLLNRPGPRILEMVKELHDFIHP